LGDIPDGARVIVYADQGDGIFEKVVAPTTYERKTPFLERLVTLLPYLLGGIGLVSVIGALAWKLIGRKKKPEPPVEPAPEEYTSPFVSGR
jgi:hypothetical protein